MMCCVINLFTYSYYYRYKVLYFKVYLRIAHLHLGIYHNMPQLPTDNNEILDPINCEDGPEWYLHLIGNEMHRIN